MTPEPSDKIEKLQSEVVELRQQRIRVERLLRALLVGVPPWWRGTPR